MVIKLSLKEYWMLLINGVGSSSIVFKQNFDQILQDLQAVAILTMLLPRNHLSKISGTDLTFSIKFSHDYHHYASREGDITTFVPSLDDNDRKDSYSPFTNVVLPSIEKQTVNNPELFEKAVEPVPTYNASYPFCQRYVGKTCQHYLENRFVFIQPPYTQRAVEENLEGAVLVVSQSK